MTESIGLTHYRHDPAQSDEALFELGYNRIYDTLEMEANLNDVERLVRWVLNNRHPDQATVETHSSEQQESRQQNSAWCSSSLCHALGQRLDELDEGPGILRSAFRAQVPVFIPAFTDSEIGLDVATWAMSQRIDRSAAATLKPEDVFQDAPAFNPFLDLQEYARLIGSFEEIGIFTIGGGVPRNWAQQVSPFYDITNERVGTDLAPKRFRYGIRICPEPVHWGGLSGCTYSEGVSWGQVRVT